jgi:hypothetical protein
MSAGANDYLEAPLSLPDGATITSVTLYYINTNTVDKLSCSIGSRYLTIASADFIFSGITSATSASATSVLSFNVPLSSGSSGLVNNSVRNYYISVFPSNAGSYSLWVANMSIKGVKITYTL